MTSRKHYASGEPCWADLQTRDVAAAKTFYEQVFGWTFKDLPTPDGRSYAQAFVKDQLVAVIAPPQNSMQEPPERVASGTSTFRPPTPRKSRRTRSTREGNSSSAQRLWPTPGVLAFIEPPGGGTTGIWQAGTHVAVTCSTSPGRWPGRNC